MMHDFKNKSNRSIDNHGLNNLRCPQSDTLWVTFNESLAELLPVWQLPVSTIRLTVLPKASETTLEFSGIPCETLNSLLSRTSLLTVGTTSLFKTLSTYNFLNVETPNDDEVKMFTFSSLFLNLRRCPVHVIWHIQCITGRPLSFTASRWHCK